MASFKFIFKCKTPVKKRKPDTKGRLHLLYTHDSMTGEFSAKLTVMQKFWDSEKGKYKKHENSIALNKALERFKGKIEAVVTDLQSRGIDPDPAAVKEAYKKALKDSRPEQAITKSMAYLWKEYIEYLKSTPSQVTGEKRSERTVNSNNNSRESFETFLSENKLQAIRPENFSLTHFHKWQAYLQKSYPSGNSQSKRLKHFKAAMKHFKKLGSKIGFDLDEVTPKEKAGLKIHIDEAELKIIEGKELIGRKDLIRDLVLIGCNVGLRISDFKRIDKNIQGNDIVIQTQKTGEPLKIPITPKVKALLEKYGNKLPVIPEPVFRKEVKALFAEVFPDRTMQVKINGKMETVSKSEYITPHSFIRSFVTISANNGIPVPLIAKITGKSVQVLLKHYLNASQEAASKAMLEVWGASPLKIAK
jgi:integrase